MVAGREVLNTLLFCVDIQVALLVLSADQFSEPIRLKQSQTLWVLALEILRYLAGASFGDITISSHAPSSPSFSPKMGSWGDWG